MKKTSLFSFVFLLAVQVSAQSLETVRGLIAAKKTDQAVDILQTDHARLLKSEKDFKDVTQWLSIFLYESSMELYQKAEDLAAAADVTGANEKFEELLEKEPDNKVALSSYMAFLLQQGKLSQAAKLIDKATLRFPYFGIFSVYKGLLSIARGEPLGSLACDKKSMTPMELDLCHLTQLMGKVNGSERDLKSLAAKTTIPDAQYWLWKGTQNDIYLKRYVSLCKGMTEKSKKNYRIVPGLCAKMREAESQLESKQNDEPNAT